MHDPWTAAPVNLLQPLWASGATVEAIGAQLGDLSRSAVLGKICRLRRAGKSASALKTRRTRRQSKQSEPPPPAPRSNPKRLLDLTNHCCRWIVEAAINGR